MLIGYARCSTVHQDVAIQISQLENLGVTRDNIIVDHGYTGAHTHRPGLARIKDRCRRGDVVVVTKLDRLARSITDAHTLARYFQDHGVGLQIGTAVYDPDDPTGKLLFSALAMIAEFERDLITTRTREGIALAKQRGRLTGRKPKLTEAQQQQIVRWYTTGELSRQQMADVLGVNKSTITRTIKRLRIEGFIND